MSFYVVTLFLCAGMTLPLALMSWTRRPSPGAVALCLFLLCVGASSLAYAMNLSSADLATKLFWNRAEYLGGAWLAGLMLVVVLLATARESWVRTGPLLLLFLVPALTLISNWTNDWHHLFYKHVWIEPSGPYAILAKDRGPLYALSFGYMHLVTAVAIFLLVRSLRRVRGVARSRLLLLLIAFLLPVLFNVPYLLRLMPHRHINLTLLGFFFTSLLLCVAMCRFQLVSALPLDMEERNQLLLNHAHALLYTIRPDGVFSYVSPNWPQLLGHTSEEVIGRSFSEFVLPEDQATCYAFLDRVVTTGTLQTGAEYRVVHKNGHIVWHTSSIMPVKDRKGWLLAYVGAAHDITRLKQTQQELSEANERLSQLVASREAELRQAIAEALTAADKEDRRIGEDIHDGLCQDLVGIARLTERLETGVADAGQPAWRAAAAHIREQCVRLASVARAFSHDLTLHELEVQTLPEALDTLARRTGQFFNANVEISTSADLSAMPRDCAIHLYRIVREAVANAVKHGQAKHIWIDVVEEPAKLVVSISNDGMPIPEEDLRRPGLGIRQMRMRARLMNAGFSMARDGQDKTVVEVELPRHREETV